jgi:hypothetical protein
MSETTFERLVLRALYLILMILIGYNMRTQFVKWNEEVDIFLKERA